MNDPVPAQPGPYGSLFLKNYKAFGPSGQTFRLSRLNLLFGPNSSGKSSVFKAIKLVVNAFCGEPLGDHAYGTTVYKGRRSEEFIIGLCYGRPPRSVESTPQSYFHFSERVGDRVGLDAVKVIFQDRLTLRLDQVAGELLLADCTLSRTALRDLLPASERNVDNDTLDAFLATLQLAVVTTRCKTTNVSRKKRFLEHVEAVPSEIVEVFERAIADAYYAIEDDFRTLKNNLVHLPPIRRIPDRHQLRHLSQSETSFLKDVENRTWEILLKTKFQSRLDETNFWMGKHGLSLGYEIVRQSDGSANDNESELAGTERPAFLTVRDTTDPQMNAVYLDLTDVGVGISQVIPVIGTACVHNDLWIMIEQPELHLHPRIQCQLGDLFIGKSKDGFFLGNFSAGNIFFIETHSEHLVLRMLRRVRETSDGVRSVDDPFALTPEELSVFYFEPNKDKGAQIHRMEITPDGDFTHAWPNGFFPERLRELR